MTPHAVCAYCTVRPLERTLTYVSIRNHHNDIMKSPKGSVFFSIIQTVLLEYGKNGVTVTCHYLQISIKEVVRNHRKEGWWRKRHEYDINQVSFSIRCGGREKVKMEMVFIIQNKYE
jgi:hypothetical protein